MKVDITCLMELQNIDLQIGKIEEKMAAGAAEIGKRQQAIDEHKAAIADLEERLERSESRRRELEAEIEDETSRLKERQTKLMNVQTNREYQSLLKEIEDGKKTNKQREEEVVQLMERTEELKTKLDERRSQCETEEKELAEESGAVDKEAKELAAEKEKIAKSREQKAKDVPGNLLRKYEILRERRNGKALAAVSDGVCKGCHMNIPPQLFIELLKAEQLLACPTCNRLMYHQPEEEQA